MRPGRSVLGAVAGVLLALGVVALAGSGHNPFTMQTAALGQTPLQTSSTSTQSVTATISGEASGGSVSSTRSGTTNTATDSQSSSVPKGGQNNSLAFVANAPSGFSHLDSIARQPITLTGFVILPIFCAFLFGFVVYRIDKVRNEGEEPPEAA